MDYKRILTLHYTGGMSGREIAEATGVGKPTDELYRDFDPETVCRALTHPQW